MTAASQTSSQGRPPSAQQPVRACHPAKRSAIDELHGR